MSQEETKIPHYILQGLLNNAPNAKVNLSWLLGQVQSHDERENISQVYLIKNPGTKLKYWKCLEVVVAASLGTEDQTVEKRD